MIRDHYFPNDSKEQIQKAILDKSASGEMTLQESKVVESSGAGYVGVQNIVTSNFTIDNVTLSDNFVSKFNYNPKNSYVRRNDRTVGKEIYDAGLLMLLKDAYLSWGRFKHFELQLKATSNELKVQQDAFGKLLGKYMKQLICYSNYQTDYVLNYTYTIPDSAKIGLFIRQFNESFIDNPNFKKK